MEAENHLWAWKNWQTPGPTTRQECHRGEGLDDNGPVNKHSIGHVQGGGQHVVVHELDEADPGLDVDAGIPEAGVQPDVLYLAEEAEQGVHLIPGGLGSDVGHLDHPGLLIHPQNTICKLLLASPILAYILFIMAVSFKFISLVEVNQAIL